MKRTTHAEFCQTWSMARGATEYTEPDDPDRHYEWEAENGAEIERERERAGERVDQLPWEDDR